MLISAVSGTGYTKDQYDWRLVLEDLDIEAMYLDNSGILWLATRNGLWQKDREIWRRIDGFGEVGAIYQGESGTLWVGAEDGLWYQQGDSWQQPEGFNYGGVSAIYENEEGLWVGSQLGLLRRDGNRWKVIVEDEEENDWWFTGLGESEDGTFWMIAEGEFLVYRLPPSVSKADSTTRYVHPDGFMHEDNEGNIWQQYPEEFGWARTMYTTSDNRLWLGTETGLWLLKQNSWQLVSNDIGWVLSIYETADKDLLLGTMTGVWHQVNNSWLPLSDSGPSSIVSAMKESRDGTLWVGTFNGLWRQVNLGWKKAQVEIGPIMPRDTFFESQDGTLWVEAQNGIWYQKGGNWQQQTIKKFDNFSKGIYETKDGNLWVVANTGTFKKQEDNFDKNGLWRQDGNGWQMVLELSSSDDEFSAFHETEDGTLWLTTTTWEELTDKDISRLLRRDGNGWQIVHEVNSWIEFIYETKDNTLWLGTGEGLWYQDGIGWRIIPDLPGETPIMYESKDGKLWVAVDNNHGESGLWRQDGTGWELVIEDIGWAMTIYETQDGSIWLGAEFGLWRKKSGETEWSKEVHVTGGVSAIFEDADGVLWIGEMMGTIWRKTGRDDDELWFNYDLLAYNQSLGIPNNGVSTIYQTSDGILWFGGLGGLAQYAPDSNLPTVKILSVDNQPPVDNYLTGRPVVTFQWAADDIETRNEHMRYQYKIDDQKWVHNLFSSYDKTLSPDGIIQQTELTQKITTPVLEDGEHRFSVRAIDYDGNVSRVVNFDFSVDTVRPIVLVTNPISNQIVGGELAIRGSILDNDLSQFHIGYLSPPSLLDMKDKNESVPQPPPHLDGPHNAKGTPGSQEIERTNLFQLIETGDQPQISSVLGNWNTLSLPDGNYKMLIEAIDQLGHRTIRQVNVILDNTQPVISLKEPADGQKLSGNIKIIADVSDLNLKQYQLKYTQDFPLTSKSKWKSISTSSNLLSANTAQIIETWNSTDVFGLALLRLSVLDHAGNWQTTEISIDLDNLEAKPTVQITNPTADSVLSGLVRIQGTASDSTLTNYKIDIEEQKNLGKWTTITSQTTVVNFGELGTWDTTLVPDGNYRLRLNGVDSNGYESQIFLSIKVDNSHPIAMIQTPEKIINELWIVSGLVSIEGTASDQNFESYWLEYGLGFNPDDWQPIATASTSFVQNGLLNKWDTSRLDDDEYTLRLTVIDRAGLSSEHQRQLILDNQQAKAELLIPSQDQYVNGRLAIIGTANDKNFSNYQLELGIGVTPTNWQVLTRSETTRQSDVLFNWDATGLEGQYTLKLIVEDFTNDQVVVKRRIIADNTPPKAEIDLLVSDAVVSGNLKVLGTAIDDHFKSFLLELGPGIDPREDTWQSIGGISNTPVKSDILRQFSTTITDDGIYSLRLTVDDKSGQVSIARRTVTIDNTPPQVTLQSPTQNQVVSQIIGIKGIVTDVNLDQVELLFRPLSSDWHSLSIIQGTIEDNRLAEWDTSSLPDGVYEIKLVATDQSGQPPTELIRTVTVDNTLPQAKISRPLDNEQISQILTLFGTATDPNFKSYWIDFGEGNAPTNWLKATPRPIMSPVEDGEILQWLAGKRRGIYSFRLTVEDQVNQRRETTVQVSITSLTEKSRGGDLQSSDGRVNLYLPPNSLKQNTIVTINHVPSSTIDWPLGRSWRPLNLSYLLESDLKKLNKIKPATLTISYKNESLTPGYRPIIFQLVENTKQWQMIGGAFDTEKKTISTVIHQLGQYGVMEMTPNQADGSATILKNSLTCQPRVFSPIGNLAPHTKTTISFQLDKAAQVSVKIYNVGGTLVNWLAEQELFPAGKVALPWNGRDHSRNPVATGLYIVTLTVGGETQNKIVNVWNQ